MAIAFVAKAISAGTPVSNTRTISSYAPGAGTDRLLVALCQMRNDSPDRDPVNNVVTMGAGTFTLAAEEFGPGGNTDPAMSVHYLKDADIPAGSTNVVLTMDSGNDAAGIILLELTGVDQTTPIGGTAKFSGLVSGGADMNADLTTGAANSWILTMGGTETGSDIITIDSDPDPDVAFTTIYEQNIGTMEHHSAYSGATAAGAYNNLAGSPNATARAAAVAVEVRAAASGVVDFPTELHRRRQNTLLRM